MSSPHFKNRNGATIADWREWTPPKDSKQWKAGRSVMELARAWFTSRTPQCPAEIEALLATHPFTSRVQFTEGVPEAITGLPGGGGGRNHDLLLKGEVNGQRIIASVEGKADEPFGNDTVGGAWKRANNSKKPTRADQRIKKLLEMVFGTQAEPNQLPYCNLRYQLLTGIAATVVEASRYYTSGQSAVGIFIVHEFHTHLVTQRNIQNNAKDYTDFLRCFYSDSNLTTLNPIIQSGQMFGPHVIGPNRFLPVPVELFVGKAIFEWD